MRLDIITIFPEYFTPLDVSLLGKARQRGILDVRVHDLRQWAYDRHRTVDDTPYGGGPGMVMKPDPWGAALDAVAPAGGAAPRLVVPTPSGRPFTQALAIEYAAEPWLTFACGRYEGIDARVVEEARTRMPVDEVSIGDYVLAGGEAAVLVMAEAVGRLLPGVLGNADSVADDSFAPGAMEGLLEGPVYTKPPVWRGRAVPEILLSGHHGAIARWRRDQALRRTAANRPELAARLPEDSLDKRDREVLHEPTPPAGAPPPADERAGAAGEHGTDGERADAAEEQGVVGEQAPAGERSADGSLPGAEGTLSDAEGTPPGAEGALPGSDEAPPEDGTAVGFPEDPDRMAD